MSTKATQAREATEIARRRVIVRELKIQRHLKLVEIVAELKTLGIAVSRATVDRDVGVVRKQIAKDMGERFDAFECIGTQIEKLRGAQIVAMRLATDTKDEYARVRALREYVRAIEAETATLQSVGLVPRDLGVLRISDPATSERLPRASEIAKLVESVTVRDEELVSEAELAWKYGDAATSHAAAMTEPAETERTEGERAVPLTPSASRSGFKIPRRSRIGTALT